MSTRTLTFVLERETKGAARYLEINPRTGKPVDAYKVDDEDALIGVLYLRKKQLKGDMPETILITIT